MDININLTVTGLDKIAEAINNLAAARAYTGETVELKEAPAVQAAVQNTQTAEQTKPQQQEAKKEEPKTAAAPATQTATQTAKPSVTFEAIQNKAILLMEAGKQDFLIKLLASFNLESLPQLKETDYDAFMEQLNLA